MTVYILIFTSEFLLYLCEKGLIGFKRVNVGERILNWFLDFILQWSMSVIIKCHQLSKTIIEVKVPNQPIPFIIAIAMTVYTA